eukprot:CAMPEP_0119549096 /NCGR_PEP_ID=MMETSP1352-20130426/2873_1 /TAXON_ID=265584 /ORGANISM="Stauroneis constricta, Strain CCMP1120" /LENGTH=476 /DNA_ID=CAMNT_0007594559 /DNA_START=181 /DNA_END=1608 /DNA_ORIENTATION=+
MAERRRHTQQPVSGVGAEHMNGGASSSAMHKTSNGHAPLSSASKLRRQPVQQQQQPPPQRQQLSLGTWASRGLLLTVAAMYSTNFATVKYLEQYCDHPPCNHDPSEAAFCRFLVSATVCLPILFFNRHHRSLIFAGMECGLWMTMNYVCQAEALEFIPAGKCAFIGALAVVTVPIFAGIFLKKPIRPMNLVSAAIALLGVAILENVLPIASSADKMIPDTVATPHNPHMFLGLGKGDLLALGQPIGFGYGVMRIEHHLERHAHIPNRVLAMTAAQCVTVCILTFGWVLTDRYSETGIFLTSIDLSYMWEFHRLMALAWTGIITTVVAIILQGIALQKASATDAALIFSTEPVWGSLFAGWLLKEKLSSTTYVGGSFILAACFIGSVSDAAAAAATTTTENRRRHMYKSKNSSGSLHSPSATNTNNRFFQTTTNAEGGEENDNSIPSLTDVRQFPSMKHRRQQQQQQQQQHNNNHHG